MLNNPRFRNRTEAGRALAKKLVHYAGDPHVLVLGLPRGGIPVAIEVAKALDAPLDVFVVRKLGVPGHQELAMGAIASGGVTLLDPTLVDFVSHAQLNEVIARETEELARRERTYRNHRPLQATAGKTVILVDDGIATGASMHAAVEALRRLASRKIVVAAPVSSREASVSLAKAADEAVFSVVPESFHAVGQWYDDFAQVTDDEVRASLERAAVERWGTQDPAARESSR